MFGAFAILAVASHAGPSLPPLPQAVSSLGAAVAGNYLYVYGGHAGRTHNYSTETTSAKFRRLNLAEPGKGWEDLAGGPSCQGLALVAHKGVIYRVGGMRPRNAPGENADNHSLTSFAKYDPAAGSWEQLADLPAGRSSHDAAVVGDTLYVFGGWKMSGSAKPEWHDAGAMIDLAKPKADWVPVPQPFQRRALTMAAYGGKIYVVAGLTADGNTSLAANIFDPATKEWTAGPPLPGDRMNGFTPAACAAGGSLYVSPADGVIYRLNGPKWEAAGKLGHPRFVHRLVAADVGLIAVGGASKGGTVAALDVVGKN